MKSLETVIEAYIFHLANEKRLSPLTCKSYASDIEVLRHQLKNQLKFNSFDQIQPHHIRHIIAQLHGNGLSGRSLARMLSAWRGLFKYLARHSKYTGSPCTGIRVPKSPKKLPATLSPDESMQLLTFVTNNVLTLRDCAIFELIYSSGLRLAELTKLKPGDINFAEEIIRVDGKGGKTRIVPVGKYALRALQAWLKVRLQIIKPGEAALFLTHHGTALSARTISHRLKVHAKQQGINQNVHPHLLRHSFASHILQSSGDLRAVQEMLGHASIRSTQVYTHLDFQHLAKIYDVAHPRAKKKKG